MCLVCLHWDHFWKEDNPWMHGPLLCIQWALSARVQAQAALAFTEFIVIAPWIACLPCLAVKMWQFLWLGKCRVLWNHMAKTTNGREKSWKASLSRWYLSQDPRWGSLSKPKGEDAIAPQHCSSGWCFSDGVECPDHLKILFKCRFWFSRSCGHWESAFLKGSQVTLLVQGLLSE